jgi:hypothetical protein
VRKQDLLWKFSRAATCSRRYDPDNAADMSFPRFGVTFFLTVCPLYHPKLRERRLQTGSLPTGRFTRRAANLRTESGREVPAKKC